MTHPNIPQTLRGDDGGGGGSSGGSSGGGGGGGPKPQFCLFHFVCR